MFSSYVPKDPLITSETYYYKKGANQLFSQSSHVFDPTPYSDEELSYNTEREVSNFYKSFKVNNLKTFAPGCITICLIYNNFFR